MRHWIPALGLALLFACSNSIADWNEERLESLKWREIGPYRGGRSAAVTGIPQDRETFYFGSTGGGVWKTGNGELNNQGTHQLDMARWAIDQSSPRLRPAGCWRSKNHP